MLLLFKQSLILNEKHLNIGIDSRCSNKIITYAQYTIYEMYTLNYFRGKRTRLKKNTASNKIALLNVLQHITP